MSEQFQVGELVIMQNATYFEEYDGFPARVLEAGRMRELRNLTTMELVHVYSYRVKILAGGESIEDDLGVYASSWQLRKLSGSEETAKAMALMEL